MKQQATTQANSTFEPYPVEIQAPDISAFAEGNCGVPYVYSFDSGVSGPHVMINALTHGNEFCGAIAVRELLLSNVRPRRGKLTLAFANHAAFSRFDAANPDASRFVDRDFNRVWTEKLLDDPSQDCSELRRAREMRPVIDKVDLLLDLHSMHERCAPLMLSGPLEKGVTYARQMALPGNIIVDAGHAEGRRLRDYSGFGDPASCKNALLVECGQHWERNAETVARQCAARFLMLARTVNENDIPRAWRAAPEPYPRVIRVTDAIVANSMDFHFSSDYRGLETFPEKGTVYAVRDGQPLATPYPNCVMVMPSLRQLRPGVTVVRLGRLDS